MRKIKYAFIAVLAFGLLSCNNNRPTATKKLKNDVDSMSYTLGLDMGIKLRVNFEDVDEELFIQGMYNGMDSTDIQVNVEDIGKIIEGFMQKRREAVMKLAQEKREKEIMKNFGHIKEAGEKFMEENKSKPGVITTASGLQYKVLKEGTGEHPKATSRVTVHYHGTTPDGEVFDSSIGKGDPKQHYLQRVIPGWTEGLQLMKEGAKYRFFIPQEIGYGIYPPKSGQGPIKPYMPLIFEIELIKINS